MKRVKAGLITLLEPGILEFIENRQGTGEGVRMQAYLDRGKEAVASAAAACFDLIDPGPVADVGDAQRAAESFRQSGAEILLAVSLFWAGDKALFRILEAFGDLPVIYWCYVPDSTISTRMGMPELYSRSGVVGAMQNAAMLRRLGRKFCFVFGPPESRSLRKDLSDYAKAFEVLKALRHVRIGQIGGRYEEMTGTYVDEFLLLKKFGAELVHITPSMVKEASDAITDTEVAAFAARLRASCPSEGIGDEDLFAAARVSMAAAGAAAAQNVDVLAIEDYNIEIRRMFGTRPHLWPDGFREREMTVSMEADAVAALNMWIARHLGETTPMYTEMFSVDIERNAVLMGHASMLDPALAAKGTLRLIPDAELSGIDRTKGAWLHFRGKEGPVVVTSLFGLNGDYTAAMFTGESVKNDLLETSPNILVRLDIPVEELFRKLMKRGMTQHFSVSYDDVAQRFRRFCEVADIDLLEIG